MALFDKKDLKYIKKKMPEKWACIMEIYQKHIVERKRVNERIVLECLATHGIYDHIEKNIDKIIQQAKEEGWE